MSTLRSFYDRSSGSPKGASSGKALAVSPSLSSTRTAFTLKGGYLSIATQGPYQLSSPHPLALSMASRPGKPATAKTSSRARTQGRRADRGAKARRKRHARTLPSNPSHADAWTRPYTRERSLILEISHSPETLAITAPSPHPMQSRVSNVALLSHRMMAA